MDVYEALGVYYSAVAVTIFSALGVFFAQLFSKAPFFESRMTSKCEAGERTGYDY